MTLSVHAYYRGEKGKIQWLEDDHWQEEGRGNPELAGVEVYRTVFYGSEAVKSFGCALLPTLATTDVYAEEKDLDVLEKEARVLLDNLPALTVALGRPGADAEEHYGFRLNNILRAVRRAQEHPSGRGGVNIG